MERFTLLLIEDDLVDQLAIARLVRDERLPYDLKAVRSFSEARTLLGSHSFDLIITDHSLGDGTAFDTLRIAKGTPVIVTTGAGNEEVAVQAMKSGAYDYLIKDVDRNYLKVLPATIEAAIKHSRAERRAEMLSHAMMNISDSVYIADARGVIVFVNRSFCRAYGYSEQEIVGLQSSVVGNVTADGECWHRRKDGSEFPVLLSVSAIKDEHGNTRSVTGVSRDITLHKQTERELRLAKEAAESATQAKSGFLAAMSHEIRTPMNGVIGMTSLLLNSELHPQQRDSLEIIRASGEALLTIINDILDFSKIEAGHLELEHLECNVRSIVEEAAEVVAASAHRKGVELVVQVDHAVPQVVIGDAGRIRQILLNFLSNAVKFTDAGEVILSVAVESADASVAVLQFSVSDTGIGIPDYVKSRMFEAFSQADTSTTRKYGGTGLGLAISKQLASLMGGEVGFRSEWGKGATFWFTAKFATSEQPKQHEEGIEDLKGRRALVLERNSASRLMLQSVLEPLGVAVEFATTVSKAVALVNSAAPGAEPYSVVIADADLAGADGLVLGTAMSMTDEIGEIPIILLTSAVGLMDVPARRIRAFLKKPVRSDRLKDCLLRTIGVSKDRDHSETVAPGTAAKPMLDATVLLAEDNAVNQKVASLLLQRLGCEVHIVANGRDAVAACKTRNFDLILMDVQMPHMDGLEAARYIRKLEGKHTPIIALTAGAVCGDREKCLEAGMDDYLTKPVTSQALAEKLPRWLAS